MSCETATSSPYRSEYKERLAALGHGILAGERGERERERERERGKEKYITCVCHTVLHVHVLTALTFLVLASALISEGEAGISVFLNNKAITNTNTKFSNFIM